MTRIFVDTDVCLDLLADRQPHSKYAQLLFSLADRDKIKIFVSGLTFANLDYLLKSSYKLRDARSILARFKTLVSILTIDEKVIDLALTSTFSDFEDAIQYFSCQDAEIDLLLTRNIRDYKKAEIRVMTPELYLKSISKSL